MPVPVQPIGPPGLRRCRQAASATLHLSLAVPFTVQLLHRVRRRPGRAGELHCPLAEYNWLTVKNIKLYLGFYILIT